MATCVVCEDYVPRGRTRCVRGHYQLATCPFCGTDRRRSVPICPTCANAWIDEPYEEPERSSPLESPG